MTARSIQPAPGSGEPAPQGVAWLGPERRGPRRAASGARAAPPRTTVDVTAVLVAHDGDRWLPAVLEALAGSTVAPRRTIAVDTGSTDATAALLAGATGQCLDRVVTAGRRLGYGAAVQAGLEAEADASGGPSTWVWLLHDDSAPASDALARLLEQASASPSVALLGAKARDWDDPRVLVEVGLSTDRAGHRETGLERHEQDHGQHDGVRDVLAVGTAGALVRRDVWDALGGLDPALPVFRDDLDLGWRVNAAGHRAVVVPTSVVRHARAATTGQRRLHAARGRPEAIDRRHALMVLLAHAPAPLLPLLVLRLALATLVRMLGFLLTRRPGRAGDELTAAADQLLHPRRLRAARRVRAGTRIVPARALRPLFASSRGRAAERADALRGWLTGVQGPVGSRLGGPGDVAATEVGNAGAGPAGQILVGDPGTDGSLLGRVLRRPPVLLVVSLLLVALVAERQLLATNGGVLAGGRLLPAPGGARDLWSAYATGWHPVSVGTAAPAPPMLALLGVLATVLLGKAWLAVDVLLLASVPLAGAAAYAAARRLVASESLRLWAAATWALLPVATGAVAAGRLDAAVAQVALPLLLPAGARLLRDDPAEVGWRHGWALGLGLAVLTAFAPTLWPLLAGLLLMVAFVAGIRSGGHRRAAPARPVTLRGAAGLRRLGAAGIVAAVPVVLLLPWSATVLAPAGRLLHGPGRAAPDPALVDAALPTWHLLLLSPGGAGLPPVWLTGGLVLAALAGLVRHQRRRLALAGWLLVLAGLVAAELLSAARPAVPGSTLHVPAWPGPALQVCAAGMLVAALVAADGARARLADADFGWRQLTAVATAVLAGLVPAAAAVAFVVRGADGPLARGNVDALPAFVQSELSREPGLRVLLLRPGAAGLGYALVGAGGVRLGAADLVPDEAQVRLLDAVVGDLPATTGSDPASALATRAVRYVALPAVGNDALAAVLDDRPGLVRRVRGSLLLWEVTGPRSRLGLLPPALALAALRGDPGPDADLLRSAPPELVAEGEPRLRPGPAGRLLVLSEAADPGWRATVDGRDLPRRTAWGWAAAFTVPEQGGALRVSYAQGGRRTALALQAVALVVVVVLAAPGAGRSNGLESAPARGAPARSRPTRSHRRGAL